MTKVFIDGSAGTTGLRIADRLSVRQDLTLITLPEELRKDPKARADALASADIAFLCLPDDAAKESVALAKGSSVRIIDTSTAHRTNPDWVYGMPELSDQREKLVNTARIANPGCHASGFIALVAPLVQSGILAKDALLTCFSLTGYSGGGKKMIAQYEENPPSLYNAPRQYALGQSHKHLPEMSAICQLENAPVFCPIVADFYSGMEVTVPLFASQIKGSLADIQALYKAYYQGGLIRYDEAADPDGLLSACGYEGRDDMGISVFGNAHRLILTARFDNLGKGASGAAIQNMNLLMGLPEDTGLNV
ncbi:MAG: N-acetyl-gamma-glutamyl-phosphate reductase [Oscillospiraceae bacterium]|nr:N-acetyl-gamma-glutamyl-phosphate reductase [Oscillospiraceae bacterium]